MRHRTFDRYTLPKDGWKRYRQRGTRWMFPASGPLTVITREGSYSLGEEWSGFIAVDARGYPYPIAGDEHEITYEAVDDE